ncbi:MAG: DUF756 domain-containing protein [Chitinophagaceae bacterium]|nr:MAG: DUF756 domain-containing protein [Chitinophagaceae bacterium]
MPKRYTVEAGKLLDDDWVLKDGGYDLEVYGPNGFFRKFFATGEAPDLEILLTGNYKKGGIRVEVFNRSADDAGISITSNAYDYGSPLAATIVPGKTFRKDWMLANSSNWYDFSVTVGDDFVRRFAGRVETSKDSISDPAMATGI